MNLNDIVGRPLPPKPWAEGDNIPWDDPAFSERMLQEHLNQEHNLASRRLHVIDQQVDWIHKEILGRRPTKIVELTCGPGLYTNRLAKLGHHCVGIDYAPASIRYADESARAEGLACTYRLEDVRKATFGDGYGLVMINFGQFNVFRREDAHRILGQACASLLPGGILLLEAQRFSAVENTGRSGNSWYSCDDRGGLFSDSRHLCLQENHWDPDSQTTTQRFFIIDSTTHEVIRHTLTTEAYTDEQLEESLVHAGFVDIRFFPSLVGVDVNEESQSANLVVVARTEQDQTFNVSH